jgi:CheY-like chemotaxis protein
VRIDLLRDEIASAGSSPPFRRLRRGHTLLVGDACPRVREVARGILQDAGHHVMLAADGESVLEGIERFRPDLVLVDLLLPGCGALGILRAVALDPDPSATPILVMSPVLREAVVRRLKAEGASGFLDKELLVDTLLFRVEQALRGAPTVEPASRLTERTAT